ncbi:MAG: HTH-type transcriptional repressor PurR [Firmicutes bacterium ADurb.Bin182]|nr:MAG: HTH-type transcriptional repressor PurR [Firmicutes bacterium ADurb.Bin182]
MSEIVTIKDISKKCNVSSATVSKALNGHSDIGEETAEYIRAVAREMGYLPNSAARALKTNRSNNIGVLFIDKTQSGLAHEYFSAVLNSLKVEAERRGFDITFISRNIGNFKMSYLEHCRYRKCDGVVIACVSFDDPEVIELVKSDLPTVTIDHVFDNTTAILSDNINSVRSLVNYIYDRGHTKIAFIHGEKTSVTQKRLASFYKTCEELGISVPDKCVKAAAYHDPKSSAVATNELLRLSDRPTCIMYPDDFSFIGGRNEIERQGLSIPGNISVVGYDGINLSQALRPRLTTWKQDTETIGREAASKLIDAIENPKISIQQQITVPGELIEGETVNRLLAVKPSPKQNRAAISQR